jgi:hypothetical protein
MTDGPATRAAWPHAIGLVWVVNASSPQRLKVERGFARNIKILRVWISPQEKNGGIPMSSDTRKYPVCEQAQRMHDVLLVSSFAVWAMLLGFAPVMTYRLLVS